MHDGFDFKGRVTHTTPEGAALVKQARRDYCEENEHSIQRVIFVRSANGKIVQNAYGCGNCDVKVELSYPDDGHAGTV